MQNIVILAGNIGQTPEVRTTQGGTKITNFSLATSRPRLSEGRVLRDENGYRVMDTEWHRITCFNGPGQDGRGALRKGHEGPRPRAHPLHEVDRRHRHRPLRL